MPKFDYKCSSCEYTYQETRKPTEPQWFTNCSSCGAVYELVSETPIDEDFIIPEPVVNTEPIWDGITEPDNTQNP